jgi:hypothetical protein
MKSRKTGAFWLTGEFTTERITAGAEASHVSDALGFTATVCDSATIKREVARVEKNRAALIADVAAAVSAAVAATAAKTP